MLPLSLIAKLLGWTKLPQWAMEAIVIAVLVAIVVARIFWWEASIRKAGHDAGVAERNAYYQPLLTAANDARIAAEARNRELQAAQSAITKDSEERHAEDIQTVTARAVDAERRIADLLREHATAGAAACRSQVPAVAGSADPGPAAGDGHDATPPGRPGSRLARDAAQCEHDADELARWLDWYRRQAALTATPQ